MRDPKHFEDNEDDGYGHSDDYDKQYCIFKSCSLSKTGVIFRPECEVIYEVWLTVDK